MNNEKAFPSAIRSKHLGMTLRDWFAGKAMQAYLSNPNIVDTIEVFAQITDVSYAYADLMIKQREVNNE